MAAKKGAAKKKPGEAERLLAQIAEALGVSEAEAELRALRDLASSLDLDGGGAKAAQEPAAKPAKSYLPQRLYLLLDGRGLDGRGMPFEVIDLPCVIGSSRKANVWINSPRIETNHLRITHGDDGWVLEDLGSEHGTFLGEKRVQRRVLRDGDDFKLAGYLRLRAELR